jgi:hypothetical protein
MAACYDFGVYISLVARRLTTVLLALLVLAACGGVATSMVLRRRAEAMVRTVYELSQRQHRPAVADLQQRFGGRLKRGECTPSADCEYEVSVSNRVLAWFGVGTSGELKTSFWASNGVVNGSVTDFTITPHRGNSLAIHVQIDFCDDNCRWFAIHPWYSSSLDANGMVEIGQQSSANSKQVALSLNTNCLSKLGGCESVADLLPSAWKVESNRIVCVVENDWGLVRQ